MDIISEQYLSYFSKTKESGAVASKTRVSGNIFINPRAATLKDVIV